MRQQERHIRHEIRFADYQLGNEDDICLLHQETFANAPSPASWRWKFADNPHGPAIIRLAWHRDRLVGHYAVVPRRFHYPHGTEQGFQEVDLMISPEYQTLGIFRELGRQVYDALRKQQYRFTFGFPNTVSLPIGERSLGWEPVLPMPIYNLYLNPGYAFTGDTPVQFIAHHASRVVRPLLRFSTWLRSRYRQEINIERISGFGPEFDELFHDLAPQFEIIGDRTAAYLTWRYINCPHQTYTTFTFRTHGKLVGWAVTAEKNLHPKELYLVDFLASKENTASIDQILPAFIETLTKKHVDVIRTWFLVPEYWRVVLENYWFRLRETEIYHVIRPLDDERWNRFIRNRDNWYLMIGDTDCI